MDGATACALPVLVSKYIGATVDLVVDGENGFVIDPDGLSGIARHIETMLWDQEGAAAMGRRALETVRARASLAESAAAFLRGVEIALGKKSRL